MATRHELWMRRFPTPHHLAAVDEQTALRSWEGLGYYRRVRSLQAIAREIVTAFGGTRPSDKEGLKKLPGTVHVRGPAFLRLQQAGPPSWTPTWRACCPA